MADDATNPSDGRTRGKVSLPEKIRSPWWELGRRLLVAVGILVGTVCWSTSTATRTATATTRPARRRPGRLDLLHDRHAEHDRVRRHRAGRAACTADQRVRRHPAPHRLPGAADRYHPRGACLAGSRDVPGRPVEEEDGSTRRRRRLRHEGPERRRDADQQRPGPRRDRGGRHRRPPRSRTRTPTASRSSPATPPGEGCSGRPASSRPPRSSSPPTATTPTCSPPSPSGS